MSLVISKDDDRLGGTEALRRARGVHRDVAAADDHHPSEARPLSLLRRLEQRDRVDHLLAVGRRNVQVVGDLRTDRYEHRIESALFLFRGHVVDAPAALDGDGWHGRDTLDFLAQIGARQSIRGNAVRHHAAGFRIGVSDLDLMPQAREVIGAGQTAGAGPDHQHLLSRRRTERNLPAILHRQIAEKALHGVDRDRGVEMTAIAAAFARVVTGAAVRRRQGVVLDQPVPGFLVLARLCVGEPALDILAGGTRVVARRQELNVLRSLPALAADALAGRQLQDMGHVVQLKRHPRAPRSCGFNRCALPSCGVSV